MAMLLKSTATETLCCLPLQRCASVFYYGKPLLPRQERPVSPMCMSSLNQHLWQLALSQVVVGVGTAGIELLVIIIMNGKAMKFPYQDPR